MTNVTSRKTAIFELEFFAIFCPFQVSRNVLRGAQLVVCTDNDGVRDSLIACQTSSVNGEPILEACLKIEYELGVNLWMSRVHTDSNIADDPSRGHVEPLVSSGCCRHGSTLMYGLCGMPYWMYHVGRLWPAMHSALKMVRCGGSFNLSGLAVRLNYAFAVQRIAA